MGVDAAVKAVLSLWGKSYSWYELEDLLERELGPVSEEAVNRVEIALEAESQAQARERVRKVLMRHFPEAPDQEASTGVRPSPRGSASKGQTAGGRRRKTRARGAGALSTRADSVESLRLFTPMRSGVWSELRHFFEEIPNDASVRWVTYSVGVDEELLVELERGGVQFGKLNVICHHPADAESRYGGVAMSLNTWRLLEKRLNLTSEKDRLLGYLPDGVGLPDGEDLPTRLHSKFVVAKHEERYWLAWGSFNLSRNSLGAVVRLGNHEVLSRTNDDELGRVAWQETEWLRGLSEPVLEQHCTDFPGGGGSGGGDIEGGPGGGTRPRPERRRAKPPSSGIEWIPRFCEQLDEMMSSHPPEGGKWQGIQYDIYCDLERKALEGGAGRNDLLYLPVGVGKTYIALRWLAFHLSEAAADPSSLKRALYLCPNEWVQRTVLEKIESICQGARLNVGCVGDWIQVSRPSEIHPEDRFIAVAADECHNWRHRKYTAKVASGTYSAVLSRLKQNQSVLGLSATPCRMDHGKFRPRNFIAKFLGRELESEEGKPFLSLREAIDAGFLCDFKEKVLLPEATADVRDILSGGRSQLVRMGDYTNLVLRDVWERIAEDTDRLVDEICTAMERHKRRKVVVFVPPVGQLSDSFVERLERRQASGKLFDFRSISGVPPRGVFEGFAKSKSGILVTVDRFSEGVSVNDIDMLVMLRATLSPRVAVQSLGRGLRNSPGKEYCLVLDGVLFMERLREWENLSKPGGDERDNDDDDDDEWGDDEGEKISYEPLSNCEGCLRRSNFKNGTGLRKLLRHLADQHGLNRSEAASRLGYRLSTLNGYCSSSKSLPKKFKEAVRSWLENN